MVNMDIKLETWKNKLLDMGKRNRLLNYRDTRRSNLRIKFPGIYDLWDSFVVNEVSSWPEGGAMGSVYVLKLKAILKAF